MAEGKLATSLTCPRCGTSNKLGTMFCTNCGSPLSAGTPAPTAAPPMYAAPGAYPGAMPGLPSAWDAERRKQIDRTKTGLLLLLIGGLISWIPIVGIFGGLLSLIGAILAISIASFAIIGPPASNAVNQATSGGTYNPAPINALQAQVSGLGYLSVIPALLFAAATYLAWSRVSHGEIPASTVPPGMPMSTMPPPGGPFPPP